MSAATFDRLGKEGELVWHDTSGHLTLLVELLPGRQAQHGGVCEQPPGLPLAARIHQVGVRRVQIHSGNHRNAEQVLAVGVAVGSSLGSCPAHSAPPHGCQTKFFSGELACTTPWRPLLGSAREGARRRLPHACQGGQQATTHTLSKVLSHYTHTLQCTAMATIVSVAHAHKHGVL